MESGARMMQNACMHVRNAGYMQKYLRNVCMHAQARKQNPF